jgi:hypothetical protein
VAAAPCSVGPPASARHQQRRRRCRATRAPAGAVANPRYFMLQSGGWRMSLPCTHVHHMAHIGCSISAKGFRVRSQLRAERKATKQGGWSVVTPRLILFALRGRNPSRAAGFWQAKSFNPRSPCGWDERRCAGGEDRSCVPAGTHARRAHGAAHGGGRENAQGGTGGQAKESAAARGGVGDIQHQGSAPS